MKNNILSVQNLVIEGADTPEHRNGLSLIIGKFFSMYLTGSQNDFKAAAQRQGTVIQAFQDDLLKFPLWAVDAGLRAYRASPQGKWAPKVSGEVIDYISSEYRKVSRTLKNCRRILEADARGLNVDQMEDTLAAITDEKQKAETALGMSHALEKACEILTDPVGLEFYRECNNIWNKWRAVREKIVIPTPEGEEEEQQAGANHPDGGVQTPHPTDGGPEV